MKARAFAARYGPVALVTGGANGIGRAFAERLVERGLSLLIVDKDPSDLEGATRALRERGAVVETLVEDLSQVEACQRVVRAGLEREVGLLINNAGIGHRGTFLEGSLQSHLDVLDVNARAMMVLAHGLAPAMCERGRGGIIFTASLAAFLGAPGVGNYAATKAYTRGLAECLHGELAPYGVDVLALKPGLTRAKGTTAGLSEEEVRRMPAMDPGPVAEAALRGLGRTHSVIPGLGNRLAALGYVLMPAGARLRRMGRMPQFRAPTQSPQEEQ